MEKWLIVIIRAYRYCISPWLGNCCRFYPSCSDYAETALNRFGCVRGSVFTMGRILRCHPFTKGGLDLVPEKTAKG